MPHIIIEYSKNLDNSVNMKQVMQACLDQAQQSELFEMSSVEARASEVPYSLDMNGETSFLHIKIALFPGRDEQKLADLSKAMYESVAKLAAQTTNISTQIVEINSKLCFHN